MSTAYTHQVGPPAELQRRLHRCLLPGALQGWLAHRLQPPAEPGRRLQPPAEPGRRLQPPAEPGRRLQPPAEPGRRLQPPAELPHGLQQAGCLQQEPAACAAALAPAGHRVSCEWCYLRPWRSADRSRTPAFLSAALQPHCQKGTEAECSLVSVSTLDFKRGCLQLDRRGQGHTDRWRLEL